MEGDRKRELKPVYGQRRIHSPCLRAQNRRLERRSSNRLESWYGPTPSPARLSGVGFFEKIGVTTMARQPFLTHTLGSHISQSGQEEQDVLPSPCHRMDDHYPNASAPVERPPSHCVSPLELGHGASPLLRPDGRGRVPGRMAAPQGADRAAAVARV